jgi:DNA-binding response OmpR family regulator
MAYILLVEDNDALSETIKDVLENNDHRCVIKHNIKFAKEFLIESKPDIIILDYFLPDGNSVTLIKFIRNELNLVIPIIGMSAIKEDFLKLKVLEAGAHDQISKPFQINELLFKIKNYSDFYPETTTDKSSFVYNNKSIFFDKLNKVTKKLIFSGNANQSEIAKEMGLSNSGISKKVKRVTGQTFSVYLAEIKIELTKNLIKEGKYNISEISAILGFKRVSHFSSFFKSNVGISPKKYELEGND